MGRDDGPIIKPQHIVKARVVEVADVNDHPEAGRFLQELNPQGRQAPRRALLKGGKVAPVRHEVPAAPGEPNEPDSQLVEDREKLDIRPQRVRALKREEQGQLPLPHRRSCLFSCAAKRKQAGGLPHLGVEVADLGQSHAQGHLRDIFAGNKQGADEDVHPGGAEVLQIKSLNDPRLPLKAQAKDIHQKVIMGINNDGGWHGEKLL